MIVDAIRSTVSTTLGDLGGLFAATGPAFDATLDVPADARTPSGIAALRPGSHRAVVRFAPESDGVVARTLCIKLLDARGPGRDQDFLLASSGNGAPLHHAVFPAAGPGEQLYSSLWLYLAGVEPVAFGARTGSMTSGRPATGDTVEFLISGLLSRFRAIGTLTLGEDAAPSVAFAARNCGDGLRALPPTSFYRG